MEMYLEFAKRLAYEAGKIMKEYFNKNQGVEYKSDRTPVTIADKKIKVSNLTYGKMGCSIDYGMWDKTKFDTLKLAKEL